MPDTPDTLLTGTMVIGASSSLTFPPIAMPVIELSTTLDFFLPTMVPVSPLTLLGANNFTQVAVSPFTLIVGSVGFVYGTCHAEPGGGGTPPPVSADESDLIHFEWNSGPGSHMVIQSYFRETPEHQTTISLVKSIVKPGDTASGFRYTVIKNFEHEIDIGISQIPALPLTQVSRHFEPNVRGVEDFAVKVEGFGATENDPISGDAGVESVTVFGEWSSTPIKK